MASLGRLGLILALCLLALPLWHVIAPAAERVEEATVSGKDRSGQAGKVPTDTRAAPVESKLKKEATPAGLKSDAPSMRSAEKMEKPKMAEPERKKPEKQGPGAKLWLFMLVIVGIAAIAG